MDKGKANWSNLGVLGVLGVDGADDKCRSRYILTNSRLAGRALRRARAGTSQHVLELLGRQLVEPGDARLQARRGLCRRPPRQVAGEQRDLAEGGVRLVETRHRQPLHDRRRHVRRDAQPHQVVHDEAVEEAAEKVLRRSGSGVAGRRPCASRRQPAAAAPAMSVSRLVALATSR